MNKVLPKIIGFLLNTTSYFSLEYATSIALNLFSKPRKGQITQEQSVFLKTANKKVFQYNEYNIMTYNWSGNKKTILLIHGWESNAGRWVDLIIDLQKKEYNVIALDAPGHGNSGSDFFNVVLYSEFIKVAMQQFKPQSIVSHSLGGMATVFSLSKQTIENTKKMVLIGAPCKYTDIIRRYTDMLGYNNRIISKLNTLITKRLESSPESLSTANHLKDLQIESLIIHDEEDDVIPYQDAILIKNRLKSSRLITTKGLGHSLKDKSVSLQILEFIES